MSQLEFYAHACIIDAKYMFNDKKKNSAKNHFLIKKLNASENLSD